ncbi:MAG: COX15/CtaA family protein [Acidobacteriota bacterium]|jgi:cytochrome c oxidase assembly protein subunit 15
MERSGLVGPDPREGGWRNRFARLVAASTLFLIFAGGMVTSTGSGLSVPDWPLSFGKVFPEEFQEGFHRIGLVRGVFYEHGHRMVAATVGMLTVVLAVWFAVGEPRRWVRRVALGALGLVILQGVLGGITVLLRLPAGVSVAHAGLANLFLCTTVLLAVVTGRWWAGAGAAPETAPLRRLTAIATAGIYVQILLGAVMRHTASGFAIPDFPLAMGRLIPPMDDPRVAIHFAHRVGAACVVILVGAVLLRTLRCHRRDPALLYPALLLGTLTAAQVTLGAFTIWTAKAAVITTFHVATGSATLATSVMLTLHAARRARAAGEAVGAAEAGRVGARPAAAGGRL